MKRLLVFPLFLLTSCVATQKDMIILQSQIDDLNTNIYTLKKNQADLTAKIDELNRTLISFTETSKDLSTEMSKLSSRIEQYGEVTEKKITQIGKNLTQNIPQPQEDEFSKQSKLFFKAIKAYSVGKTKAAKELFKEYLASYPKDENIDLVYFYLAEILFVERDFKEAAILYAKIISEFPSISNIDYVKLRYVLALREMKEPSKEREIISYLKDLQRNAKDSYIQNISKALLNEISKRDQQKIEK